MLLISRYLWRPVYYRKIYSGCSNMCICAITECSEYCHITFSKFFFFVFFFFLFFFCLFFFFNEAKYWHTKHRVATVFMQLPDVITYGPKLYFFWCLSSKTYWARWGGGSLS